ncbi:MAG: 50S ribosomal protein L24 [Candidatus Mycalebacterium zealandia]|nr:MAG: 50S ribosomal protein L24 [Candidatus Mycalebacterium zealandia]
MGTAKFHIKKGDEVIVLAGKEKGKQGTVSKIVVDRGRAIVEKLNMVKRNVRPNQKNPSGGIIDKEASLHISNLMLYDSKESSPIRTGYKIDEKGKKLRVNRKTGKQI